VNTTLVAAMPSNDTTCVSCGRRIPLGQGRSCSMCYGDIAWGRDGYAEEEYRRAEEEAEAERAACRLEADDAE